MADSEDVGGISVSLGASDAKLVGDLAEAEKLVQAWAKEASSQATISLRANFAGGAGGSGGGRGFDPATLTKAIEQGFARFTVSPAARQARAEPAARTVYGAGASTKAASENSTGMQRAIAQALREKTGEEYDPATNAPVPVGQRLTPAESRASQPVRLAEAEASVAATAPEIDVSGLQGEIKGVVAALGELHTALTAATEGVARGAAPAQAAPVTHPVPVAIKEVEAAAARPVAPAPRPTAPTGTAGGGGRRGTRNAAPAGDEEEGGGLGIQTKMSAYALAEGQRHDARVQQTRRSSGQRAFSQAESQRKQELVAQGRQYTQLEKLADTYFSKQETRAGKLEDQASLQALSDQNQSTEAPALRTAQNRPSARGAPALTLGADAERINARDQAAANAANARPVRRRPTVQSSAVRAAQQRDEEVFSRSGPNTDEARNQRIEEDIERRRANITASGSTGRTSASRIGALTLGTQGRLIEVETRLAAARRGTTEANRAALPFERNIATYNDDIANSSGKVAAALTKQRDAFKADPKTIAAFKRQADAIKNEGTALQNLQKLQGGGNIVRNLAAVAVGSFAFSAALQAVAVASSIVGPAIGNMIDVATGFGATNTRVTSDLAKQTKALYGNVDAVLAQSSALAGVSGQSAAYLSDQLKLTTQVKAGAQAQGEASDLFRAAAGAQGGAPQGLNGGYGGIGGSALFAEQLGGGKGFREQLAGDARAFQLQNVKTQSPGEAATDTLGDFAGSLNPFGTNFADFIKPAEQRRQAAATQGGATPALTAELDNFNTNAKRGAEALGQVNSVSLQYTQDQQAIASAIEVAKAAGDDLGETMARSGVVARDASGAIADYASQIKASEQAAVGAGIAPPEELGKAALFQEKQREAISRSSLDALKLQQAFARASVIGSIQRQGNYAREQQLPAQIGLAGRQSPLTPVGTGYAAAGTAKQMADQKASKSLQVELNTEYQKGEDILRQQFNNPVLFSPAQRQEANQLLTSITAIGKQMAGISAGVANEQALAQTHQYNEQLRVTRRSLQDISGLTGRNFGGGGSSYLGRLEKENLALGRQGQLLQFSLSQKQINFQRAVAGFEAPGLSPAEMAARQDEAKIETSYAQKQLDIQKQMFGNQVQIVDISNLRQGVDLAHQISLLTEGRRVSIDTAAAQEHLALLAKKQEILTAKVGTYTSQVASFASAAMGDMAAFEAAAGKAIGKVGIDAIKMVYGFTGQVFALLANPTGAKPNSSGSPDDRNTPVHATGYVGTTSGPTMTGVGVMGEAGAETYAILRNPRPLSSGATGGGTVTNIINVTGNSVRSDADIDTLTRKIAAALGRDAQSRGLRAIGNS